MKVACVLLLPFCVSSDHQVLKMNEKLVPLILDTFESTFLPLLCLLKTNLQLRYFLKSLCN